ncbi:DUF5789 family protein [Halomicrobium urmianum]|uniref:DUF5789 family protein n=1 Tax=Halomicrobium urmianum TaxID=1586233 RepID=UPI001CDA3DA8|nr:hypothetical protein [Halomicrobium urmianum]
MADDRSGRDKKGLDADRRQREREIRTELERWDETEPPIAEPEIEDLDAELESVEFPATGAEVVAAVGDREIAGPDGSHAVSELVANTDSQTFDAPRRVRVRVRRPRIAGAMRQVLEASEGLNNTEIGESQREAYEKTFRALKAIEEDDEDEGIRVAADWIVEQIRDEEKLPSSRAVRRRAAKFCRANGYEVRSDEWLGI